MAPRYLQETVIHLCIIVGVIVGGIGSVWWIASGFSNLRALLCAVLGAAIFFGFRKVETLGNDYEDMTPEEKSEDAP